MDKDRSEKEEQNQKLEELLFERLESKSTPFTHADFEEIKKRGMARLKAKRDNQTIF
ncbi:MAG: hypothetical protein H0U45_14450 [Tatlockia sp.]|nr:hypothetical protein [Tatlockia sp.]